MIRNREVDQTYEKMSMLFETEANTVKLNFEEARLVLRRMLHDIDIQAFETWYMMRKATEPMDESTLPEKPINKDNPYY